MNKAGTKRKGADSNVPVSFIITENFNYFLMINFFEKNLKANALVNLTHKLSILKTVQQKLCPSLPKGGNHGHRTSTRNH